MATYLSDRSQQVPVNGVRLVKVILVTGFPKTQHSAKMALEQSIGGVTEWMFANRLKLNMDKTDYIPFGTRQ